jgi:hypothetical protein
MPGVNERSSASIAFAGLHSGVILPPGNSISTRTSMSPGELATRWTVHLALAGYLVGGALRADGRAGCQGQRIARIAWTLGCLFYLAHVACAFHFYHGWSHAAAYRHTAERTVAVVGWNWGGGIYFNYAFTVVWLADAVVWWRRSDRAKPGWLEAVAQAFLWFVVFNATVVFGHGAICWLGLAGCGLLVVLWWLRRSAAEKAVA